ncbi:MAG: DUF3365 domain-containing protein [Bacteroidetes bacterium]|nr:DUF3365 domain-containing protein [Bacteroidota bacterium]
MKTKNLIWISFIWTLLIISSYAWNYHLVVSNTIKVVENKARSFFDQILVTRAWNSSHGGLYVPVTEITQPNPWLKDSLRDVTTLNGMKLTKINPAYMTRQIAEINKSENDLQFHITSLNPIRPANRADKWETKALKSFRNDKDELLELIKVDSVSEFRFMAPLITTKSCLKCHAVQGYKLGDIRGGISISFPSLIYNESQQLQLLHLFFAHVLILLVGLFGIFLYFRMSSKLFAIIAQKNEKLEADGILLRQSNQKLRESLERNRATVAAMPDIFFSISRDGYFINCQGSDATLLLISKDEFVGKTLHDVLPSNIAEKGMVAIAKAIETADLQVIEYELEFPTGRKWFELRIVSSSQNEVLAISRDITLRKLAEEEIKMKNEELLKLNAEKDKFFSIIAHDLRSPFNSFLGLTKIMAEELPSLSMDEIQKIAVNMRNSASNLFQLLENLLQWAMIRQGLFPENLNIIQLRPIVYNIIAMNTDAIQSKNILVSFDIPDDVAVVANRNMLQTALRNLISNAVKFTAKEGKISLSAKKANDKTIEISIQDSGIGMNPEMVENLFRLDVQTSRTGTEGEPSSGLGLLLCKEFIEKMGGRIWIESEAGRGSTFSFSLPSNLNDKIDKPNNSSFGVEKSII